MHSGVVRGASFSTPSDPFWHESSVLLYSSLCSSEMTIVHNFFDAPHTPFIIVLDVILSSICELWTFASQESDSFRTFSVLLSHSIEEEGILRSRSSGVSYYPCRVPCVSHISPSPVDFSSYYYPVAIGYPADCLHGWRFPNIYRIAASLPGIVFVVACGMSMTDKCPQILRERCKCGSQWSKRR